MNKKYVKCQCMLFWSAGNWKSLEKELTYGGSVFHMQKNKNNPKTQLFKPMKQDLTKELLEEFSYQKSLTLEGE